MRYQFFLRKWNRSGQTRPDNAKSPCIVFTKDNWNDFGFYTSFEATYFKDAKSEGVDLGYVKFMKKGETSTTLPDFFDELNEDFCSLGQSLKYYRLLARLSVGFSSRSILVSLRDAALSKKILNAFEDEKGFYQSLNRDQSNKKELEIGAEIINKNEVFTDDFRFSYTTHLRGAQGDHKFDFDFTKNNGIPHRFNIIVGPNGVGKSAILQNLAQALIRKRKKETIEPDPMASQVISVSYSAFDNFPIPSSRTSALTGYKYCGLRKKILLFKITQELEAIESALSFGKIHRIIKDELALRNIIITDTIEQLEGNEWRLECKDDNNVFMLINEEFATCSEERLIDTKGLGQELAETLKSIKQAGRDELLQNVLGKVIPNDDIHEFINSAEARLDIFKKMSAGQRIITSILTGICAFIERESIVLIDEPETHLHPGLLSSFMSALYEILEAEKSFSIIATHSAYLLQQVPSRCVHTVKRIGSIPEIGHLAFESFGASTLTIYKEVLGLAEPGLDYHETLDKLVKKFNAEEINELFNNKLELEPMLYLKSIAKGRR